MNVRFYVDPETDAPHFHKHGVDEEEVDHVLTNPGEDRPGQEDRGSSSEKTQTGRYLRVIYVPDPESENVFVVTAYELRGKSLFAYRRRLRKKGKR